MSVYMFDASAVLAALNKEPGNDKFEACLSEPDYVGYITSVNMSEVLQKLMFRGGVRKEVRDAYDDLKLICLAVDEETARLAADLYPNTRPANAGIADRICMAAAIIRDVTAVTTDRAWTQLSIPGLKVLSLR